MSSRVTTSHDESEGSQEEPGRFRTGHDQIGARARDEETKEKEGVEGGRVVTCSRPFRDSEPPFYSIVHSQIFQNTILVLLSYPPLFIELTHGPFVLASIGCPSEAANFFKFAVSFSFPFLHPFTLPMVTVGNLMQAPFILSNGTPQCTIPDMSCPCHLKIRTCKNHHTAMSYSHRSTWRSTDKQGLYEFIDQSSKWLIEDEDNVSRYFEHFQTLSNPLIYFGFISKSECNQLFWQGFHPNNCAMLLPHLVGRRST